ncbi:putative Histidine kinase [Nitrospira tepida]|uniref:histidine kinase n=1 Tax=Nitrospira tepida TaxID=2973512 RepID=A0AA86MWS2_9BACT|nr:ATP-binding protein [Nitrospira tepida]CAI4030324.1 putative Histidine kinase [Nitrospira tepida]
MAASSSPPNLPQYDPQTLLNSQPVIVSVIDPETHRVQFQNETGLRKFGDIACHPCYEKIAGNASPCAFCRMPEALATGGIVSSEVALPNNQYLLIHWSQARTADGRVHVIETIADVSEHKRIEHSLRQAQKMEAIGRLAGGIAHDFNNLLMVVIGHAQRLIQQLASHPSRHELEFISQAGTRAAALTKKLLTFSRHQVLEQRELHPNSLLREMEDILRRLIGEQIQIVIVLDPKAGHFLGDPVQVEQVMLNLALNARDAMPDGGILTIETGNMDVDEEFVRRHPGSKVGPHIKFVVEDTGCGIDADTLAHIFEPFFSTKEFGKGTGLGLATVYGIVKQSGGYIDVASQPGRGSRFTVLLPRIVKEDAEPDQPTDDAAKPIYRGTILIVEDDEGIRHLMGAVLRDEGFEVLEAGDGNEALKMLQLRRGHCDLLIADVVMPRMKGAVLVQGVRAMVPAIKVLYISGYAGETLSANGVDDQAAFLQKPFLPSALTEKVNELLSASSTQTQGTRQSSTITR